MKKPLDSLITNDIYPLVGVKLTTTNSILLDFTAKNEDLATLDISSTPLFDDYVFGQLNAANKRFGIGGYLEPRAIYHRSEVFGKDEEKKRSIHLGVDIWAKAGQPIYAPLAGRVHSFRNNEGYGNYGPTIILEHQCEDLLLFSLYGHLTKIDLEGLEVGQAIHAGQEFAHIGPFPENGDWPPHLHFQLILDLENHWGDYPGVCAPNDLDFYRNNCPDPELLLDMQEGIQ
ncbi:peptidoglycan DD-metalloendopeptidase family protein [Echinicola soli]|uniref:Peptidoglycan DD-metalloendopeptidase family protein n=1 Tax=Echinicola soli TaxID=2591634 RepID=A0A514CER0_9BACT|nr:peptidoglycan DD-metalloendopeptidase family protein [Echinicola soli]QDH78327.1 peptidoglycan DD-metalloendopeptidase family protein [Echinicola soli]